MCGQRVSALQAELNRVQTEAAQLLDAAQQLEQEATSAQQERAALEERLRTERLRHVEELDGLRRRPSLSGTGAASAMSPSQQPSQPPKQVRSHS